ncbi:hypothetical protein U9M48_044594 [Paspalum notatum var. saurae]|uniref:Uncharacterized protein n=1 Tax=Paspalum notatum var. saurae TaxID=547442 RepID=A0AAQ3XIP5_PASNO
MAAAGTEKGVDAGRPSDAEAAAGFGEEQEALVLSAWDAMKGNSESLALKFFLRYYCYIVLCDYILLLLFRRILTL